MMPVTEVKIFFIPHSDTERSIITKETGPAILIGHRLHIHVDRTTQNGRALHIIAQPFASTIIKPDKRKAMWIGSLCLSIHQDIIWSLYPSREAGIIEPQKLMVFFIPLILQSNR